MVFEAIRFVADAHAGHFRKGTNVPYISHLVNVMKILCEHGCAMDVVVAGVLHDVVEDTPVTLEEVEQRFGPEVAFLVRGASETSKINGAETEAPWLDRKQHTLRFLEEEATQGQLLVSCADKLDNATAILQDYQKLGDALWTRFNAGKAEQKWYYSGIARAFEMRGKEFGEPLNLMAAKLSGTVALIFDGNPAEDSSCDHKNIVL